MIQKQPSLSDLERRARAIFSPEEDDGELDAVIVCRPYYRYPWPQIATLASARIPFQVTETAAGFELHVPRHLERAARRELLEWRISNRHWPPKKAVPLPEPRVQPYPNCGLWSLVPPLVLFFFFVYTGPFDSKRPDHLVGCWSMAKIHAGEWWRCITSLTLHADEPHLLGNLVALWGFGFAVCRSVGIGVGWMSILLSGCLGNLISAMGESAEPKLAIGASTATFGALGILVIFQSLRNARRWRNFSVFQNRGWIPIVAGLLLLGFLGTAPNADQVGHLWGFLSGLAIGALLFPIADKWLPMWIQIPLAQLALLIPLFAWEIATW
jgi:membrane associated rhomboid family serine protease